MAETILVTGGAGFIGSHLCDDLLAAGCHVRVLDLLTEQVHGPAAVRPEYLAEDVELLHGDVRDPQAVVAALQGVDAVVHLAAAVGVGQSMYQIAHYTSTNNLATAVLLEALTQHPVRRLVVASSMSIYGEGLYCDAQGISREVAERTMADFEAGRWDLQDADGEALAPLPTPETKTPCPSSVYALSKFDQEKLCLIVGQAYRIPTVALRFFNVYGPRQALSNPYTGVLAIFASRLMNGLPPLIFEDGRQRRDFVNVHDVARACRLALTREGVEGEVFNIGSGVSRSIVEVAEELSAVLDRPDLDPQITRQYRFGDIRHCFADISKAQGLLGYRPQITFRRGLSELAAWLGGQCCHEGVEAAREELAVRGLLR